MTSMAGFVYVIVVVKKCNIKGCRTEGYAIEQ